MFVKISIVLASNKKYVQFMLDLKDFKYHYLAFLLSHLKNVIKIIIQKK